MGAMEREPDAARAKGAVNTFRRLSLMLALDFPQDRNTPLNLLFLGAHSDDIEIGCGGTVLELLSAYSNVHVVWVIFSASPEREIEARRSAARFLEGAATRQVIVMNFRDGYFPYAGVAIKEAFEELKSKADPDLIFTHHREDRHQDHRTISDLTWNTWRSHMILEYEIPKYDADLGSPNVFVPLDRQVCNRKVEAILDMFRSERNKGWMTAETFHGLLRLRGIQCASPQRYAEAFHCRKMSLGIRSPCEGDT
jgi:LmbE family N-acetylglucosaminyl deacetylase